MTGDINWNAMAALIVPGKPQVKDTLERAVRAASKLPEGKRSGVRLMIDAQPAIPKTALAYADIAELAARLPRDAER